VRPGSGRGDHEIERSRRDHAADGACDRQRCGAPPGEMADGELALDLEPDDKKEEGQSPSLIQCKNDSEKLTPLNVSPNLCS